MPHEIHRAGTPSPRFKARNTACLVFRGSKTPAAGLVYLKNVHASVHQKPRCRSACDGVTLRRHLCSTSFCCNHPVYIHAVIATVVVISLTRRLQFSPRVQDDNIQYFWSGRISSRPVVVVVLRLIHRHNPVRVTIQHPVTLEQWNNASSNT